MLNLYPFWTLIGLADETVLIVVVAFFGTIVEGYGSIDSCITLLTCCISDKYSLFVSLFWKLSKAWTFAAPYCSMGLVK